MRVCTVNLITEVGLKGEVWGGDGGEVKKLGAQIFMQRCGVFMS